MLNNIKAVIFDIDGVVTDGKRYTDGKQQEMKSIAYKDLDAINGFQELGILVGCISGEDTAFSRYVAERLDFSSLGKKDKKRILERFCSEYQICITQVCYVGDGKYDINSLEYAGVSVCPHDAICEAQKVSDIILDSVGGQGCIAELYTRYQYIRTSEDREPARYNEEDALSTIKARIVSHCEIMNQVIADRTLLSIIDTVCQKIIDVYRNGGQLFLCGNGGSASDAQHLAAELVGRFYLERYAYSAEALSTNTSVITALANDYAYNIIFARQIETKGRGGDMLIGITTSGKSENVFLAFRQAKKNGMSTILMTGKVNGYLPILEYTDYIISIPSDDTPRIQEGHILIGHIICEIVETKLSKRD